MVFTTEEILRQFKIETDQETGHLRFPESVAVLICTPNRRYVLVEQHRAVVQGNTIELPGGRIEPRERPLDAAVREAAEETGHLLHKLRLLHVLDLDFSASRHRTYLYLAKSEKNVTISPEGMTLHLWTRSELVRATCAGKITHAPTVVAALWLNHQRRR